MQSPRQGGQPRAEVVFAHSFCETTLMPGEGTFHTKRICLKKRQFSPAGSPSRKKLYPFCLDMGLQLGVTTGEPLEAGSINIRQLNYFLI